MKNKKEINPLQGIRLNTCLEEARISQRSFADLTGYTAQHINNIIKGKRGMSLEAARTFSQTLFIHSNGTVDVSENYLLGETSEENYTKAVIKNINNNDKINSSFETIFNLLGYGRTKTFWSNFDNLDSEEKNEYNSPENQHLKNYYPLRAGCTKIFEFLTPNNQLKYITEPEYYLLLDELRKYISFKFNYELEQSDAIYEMNFKPPHNDSDAIIEMHDATLAQECNVLENDLSLYISADESKS